MKRDSQWALSLTCVARIPRRSDSRLRASSSRSVWNSWTPSRSELCSSRTFYKTKQITHKNTLLLTQYTLKGSGHCAAHMTLSSQHLQHNNLSESLTRFFCIFWGLKYLTWAHINRQKTFRELFRFCEDIRTQSPKNSTPRSVSLCQRWVRLHRVLVGGESDSLQC